jgi:hypothetical protein
MGCSSRRPRDRHPRARLVVGAGSRKLMIHSKGRQERRSLPGNHEAFVEYDVTQGRVETLIAAVASVKVP